MIHSNPLADISAKKIVKFFLCGLALVAVSDVPNTWGVMFVLARGVLAIILLSTLFMPVRHAILTVLMLALAGQDLVSSGEIVDSSIDYSTASIWQMSVGPLNPSYIIFGILLWRLITIRGKILLPFVKWPFLWLTTVPVATGMIYGGFFSGHAEVEVVQDIKFVFMLIVSIVLFISILSKNPQFMNVLLSAFAGTLFARHIIDLIYIITNVGPSLAHGVSRGSEDSAKGGVVFLMYFGLITLLFLKKRLLGVAVTIMSVVLLVAYGTRNIWITFVLGNILLFFFIGIRRSILFIVIGAVLLATGIGTLLIVNPKTAEIVFARSKDITHGRQPENFSVLVEYNLLSRIDQVRYAQILNVIESVGRRNAYLWGTGYGGYYEDYVVKFQRDLKSSFAQYSLDEGRYFRTHSFSTHMFLKFGLLGMIFIYTLWFLPAYSLFKVWRRRNVFLPNQPRILNSMMLSMVAFIPTAMFQTYWSGKGLFINGFVIAVITLFARGYSLTVEPTNLKLSVNNNQLCNS